MAPILLGLGVELRCPHCHRWHAVTVPHAEDSTAANNHCYVTCGDKPYFVGILGTAPRWPARQKATA